MTRIYLRYILGWWYCDSWLLFTGALFNGWQKFSYHYNGWPIFIGAIKGPLLGGEVKMFWTAKDDFAVGIEAIEAQNPSMQKSEIPREAGSNLSSV